MAETGWLNYSKHPEENLDFAFDFTGRLEVGETITSYEVTVPDGLIKGETSEAQGVVTVWIDGARVTITTA
jgi:hypothetical protein